MVDDEPEPDSAQPDSTESSESPRSSENSESPGSGSQHTHSEGPRRRLSRLRWVRRGSLRGHLLTAGVLVLCGFMISWAALASQGRDLRPESESEDLAGLVRDQASHNADQARQAAEMRAKVDRLSKVRDGDPKVARSIDALSPGAGLTAVSGPAIRVTLDDAPLDVKPDGVDQNLLVVHQQDIQMVVNVLWAGGAEAMTIQGQRVTSATGIKCVGNTVVLHGVPYAPPYRIEAMGDVPALQSALDSSEAVKVYKEYVTAYRLGWAVADAGQVTMPAYKGTLAITHASPIK